MIVSGRQMTDCRKVRVMINPRSGMGISLEEIRNVLEPIWDVDGIDLTYQISRSVEDGVRKAKSAVRDNVDTVLIVGGDGMVNSIGSALIGTNTALGLLPTGSGNGFARHFDIPLNIREAAILLKEGRRVSIDVGYANDHPFFVTCGLAWDADLVKGFEEFPIRGVLPYVFAGIYRWFTYEPQRMELTIDGQDYVSDRPIVLTVANLTQYGGGAKIAPYAQPDDGYLELVEVRAMDSVVLASKVHHLFDGSIEKVEEANTRRFKRMEIKRERATELQVDGELLKMDKDFAISVEPGALSILAPPKSEKRRTVLDILRKKLHRTD